VNKRRFGSFDSCMRQCGLHVHLSRALWESGHLRHALIDLRRAKVLLRAAATIATLDDGEASR